ncbi:MAG: FhaA domain-containing protein [Anaerolineales bacterium]|jgi:hypothetical protein
MKSQLDRIESRLRALIEGSAQLLPWHSYEHQLANRLVTALKNVLSEEISEQIISTTHFIISLPPDDYSIWSSEPFLLETLAGVLQEAALENGITFTRPPTIELAQDAQLPQHEIRVSAAQPQRSVDETAVLTLPRNDAEDTRDARSLHAFLIINNTQTYPLRDLVINIGRRPDNHIIIDDPRVSRNHAQLRASRGRYVIFDLGSTGGTFVNGTRITQHVLKPGDVISLAGIPVIYGEDAPQSLEDTSNFPPGLGMQSTEDK